MIKPILGGLLALQLMMAAGVYWGTQRGTDAVEQGSLLDFDAAALDRIEISDGDVSVTLEKRDGAWQLPALQNLPAASQKVASMLDKLAGLQKAWPVATTASSHARFEVADDTFQRRIALYHDEKPIVALYVGTSPGFRKVHVRADGDNAVITAELNTYDLPVKANEWLDANLLNATEVTRIVGPDYALQKQGDNWQIAPARQSDGNGEIAADGNLDVSKVLQLATAFGTLRVQDVAEHTPEPEGVTLQVGSADGEWTYEFFQTNDDYLVRRNDRDTIFSLSKYDYDRIAGISYADLIIVSEENKADDGGDEAGSVEN